MASFDDALAFVLPHEGGWSDNPNDPGGPTNHGITLRTAQLRLGISSPEELKEITPQQVADIYRADYWRFGAVTDQRIASKLLDLAVNLGLKTAVMIAQRALGAVGDAVMVDGVWGPATQKAANSVDAAELLEALCKAAAAHYEGLASANPRLAVFLHGWIARAYDIPGVA